MNTTPKPEVQATDAERAQGLHNLEALLRPNGGAGATQPGFEPATDAERAQGLHNLEALLQADGDDSTQPETDKA